MVDAACAGAEHRAPARSCARRRGIRAYLVVTWYRALRSPLASFASHACPTRHGAPRPRLLGLTPQWSSSSARCRPVLFFLFVPKKPWTSVHSGDRQGRPRGRLVAPDGSPAPTKCEGQSLLSEQPTSLRTDLSHYTTKPQATHRQQTTDTGTRPKPQSPPDNPTLTTPKPERAHQNPPCSEQTPRPVTAGPRLPR